MPLLAGVAFRESGFCFLGSTSYLGLNHVVLISFMFPLRHIKQLLCTLVSFMLFLAAFACFRRHAAESAGVDCVLWI